MPKYDLFFIPGSLTGLRIQDLISLVLFLSLFDGKITRNNLLIVLLLANHCFYSIATWNNNLSFLGLFRLFEYYAVGLGVLHLVNIRSLIFSLLLFFYILGFYQLYNILVIPNFDPGRGLLYNRSFSGSFGTPAELSYFLISVLFLFNKINEKIGISSYFSLFVLLNGVNALLGFLYLYWDHIRRINYLLGLMIVVSLLIVIYISRDIFLIGLDFLLLWWRTLLQKCNLAELKMGSGIDVGSETLSMRIGKWTISLSLLYNIQ